MPRVAFTRHLQRFFPKLKAEEVVEGATVREALAELEKRYPGFSAYVVDETGRVRRHVNVFVREEPICDRETLSDAVAPGDEIYILQGLTGG